MKRRHGPWMVTALALLLPAAPAVAADGDPDEDLTPPIITITQPAGGHAGWYATAPTVFVRATDEHLHATGVRSVGYSMNGATNGHGTVDRTLGGEIRLSDAAGRTRLVVTAMDGNFNEAERSIGVGVDPSPPQITFTGGLQDGAVFAQDQSVTAAYSCADDLSGVASCEGTSPPGGRLDTATLGEKTFTVTARDHVGRTTSRTLSYRVVSKEFTIVRHPSLPARSRMGEVVTATEAEFSPAPSHVEYIWRRNGQPISGATGRSYRTTPADVGADVSVVALAYREGWASRGVASSTMAVDAAEIHIDAEPTLVGSPERGEALAVDHGVVTPEEATVVYEWYRDGQRIPGAAGRVYWTGSEDVGHRLSARVRAAAPGYGEAMWATDSSAPIRGYDLEVEGVTSVRGTMKVGSMLTVTAPAIREPLENFVPGESASLAFRWLRDGQPIQGATGARYRLRPADVGRHVTVRVTGTAPGFEPAVSTSPPGRAVRKASPQLNATVESFGKGSARVTVIVRVPGLTPQGTVVVRDGTRVVGRKSLKDGRLIMTLRGQPRGRTTYVIAYSGALGIDKKVVRRSTTIR